MDLLLALAIVVFAGSYVGYSYFQKFSKNPSPKNGCTGSCSGCGCGLSGEGNKP
jgi:hypothetical protein